MTAKAKPFAPPTNSPDLCYLIGALMSDGHATSGSSPRIQLCVKEPDFVYAVYEAFLRCGFPAHPPRSKSITAKDMLCTTVNRKLAAVWIEPILYEPGNALPLIEQFPYSFLAGYYDGDGSLVIPAGYPRVLFSFGVRWRALMIETLLKQLGFMPRWSEYTHPLASEGKCYTVGLYKGAEVRRFFRLTPSVIPYKRLCSE